jgi:murein DD-endopeptidase MepM/ murein hydrolase activator NlpD
MKKDQKLLFIWEGKNRVKSTSLTKKRFAVLLIGSFFILFLIIIFSFNLVTEKIYQVKLERLRQSNTHLTQTLGQMKDRIDYIQGEIQNLNSKDKALRTYADIPVIDQDICNLGVGGRRIKENLDLDQLLPSDDIKVSELVDDLDKLERALRLERISYEMIYDAFKHRSNQIRSTPSIRPLNTGYLNDGFGWRKDPFTKEREFHYGIDITAPMGTPVFATADGVVRETKYQTGYGKTIEINHGFGYATLYAHLSKYLVKPGQAVKRGDKIAEVGATGRVTGPHLHYEVHQYSKPQNPLDYYFVGSLK